MENATFELIKTCAEVAGVLIAAVSLQKASTEYVNQGLQRRAEHFLELNKQFENNYKFVEICVILENPANEKLSKISYQDKLDFIGFYEKVALLVQSNLVDKSLAFYFFGYFAIRCLESEPFWRGINKKGIYWRLFRVFAEEMKSLQEKLVGASKDDDLKVSIYASSLKFRTADFPELT